MISKMQIGLFSSLIIFFMVGCADSPINTPVCSAEFVTINLEVTDANGQPVENATISVIHKESGDTLQVCKSNECATGNMGTYTIFHDGFMDKVSFDGDTFTIEGTAEEGSFNEEFVFARNECHVFKKCSPDTVIIN